MPKWSVPVSWEMYAAITIEAPTLEEAMEIARDEEGVIPLPEGYYVDGSWRLNSDDPEEILDMQDDKDIEEGGL